KFMKLNRSTCFQRKGKLVHFFNDLVFKSDYSFSLVCLENSYMDLIQLKTMSQLFVKQNKLKPLVPERDSYFEIKSLYNLNNFDNLINLINDRLILSNRALVISNFKNYFEYKIKKSRRLKKSFFTFNFNMEFPITKKPLGIRMGKGKSEINNWVAPVWKGLTLITLRRDVNPEKALNSLYQIKLRLPFKTKIIYKRSIFSFWKKFSRRKVK